MESRKDFPKTLAALMEMHELGVREIARRTEAHGWGHPSTISLLLAGRLKPSYQAMEAIARAVGVDPKTFAEYRLMCVRRELDPEVVGLDPALTELDAIEACRKRARRRRSR